MTKNLTLHNKKSSQKRRLALLAAVLLTLLTCGCGKQGNGSKTLYQHGLELTDLMAQMAASEEYGNLLGADNPSFEPLRQGIAAGDYTTPTAVYELTFPSVQGFLSALGEANALEGLPDTLKDVVNARIASMPPSHLNAQVGTNAVALASLYTAEKTFVSGELEEDTTYLYLFDNGYPIAVSFRGGEDNTVKATGMFLLMDGIDASSLERMKEAFALLGLDCSTRLLEERK